jgi:cardiolipin synthase
MNEPEFFSLLVVIGHLTIQVALVLRALMRPHREPASRIAWVLVILIFPILGILAYLFLGETSIGRRRAERLRQTLARLPGPETVAVPPSGGAWAAKPVSPGRYQQLFDLGQSITGFAPCRGNQGYLAADSDSAIAELVADINASRHQVHLLFNIWLPDRNSTRVAEALMRAAGRGVICRAMADDLGSRRLIRSPLWTRMAAAGVGLARALPTGNPLLGSLLGPLRGRVDLRNHRKLAIIDNRITWCGSQNCADPAFLIKAKYGPWVDILARFEGPIARQNQWLFVSDWMANQEGEDLRGCEKTSWIKMYNYELSNGWQVPDCEKI